MNTLYLEIRERKEMQAVRERVERNRARLERRSRILTAFARFLRRIGL